MSIDERMWKIMQKRLGYTDEELKTFKENPRNVDILAKQSDLMNKTLIIEIVESHGCNSRHKVGDKFYFDGAGNLLVKQCQKNICVHALSAAATLIFAANELVYAGVDPNEMRFKRVGCAADVGLKCGGWGRVVLELRAEDKKQDNT
jgi:uncharacterized repeat protein (TIGR04076 family)